MTVRWDEKAAIAAMRASGDFYLRRFKRNHVLYTRARQLDGGSRSLNRDMLTNWLEDKEVDNPYTLATQIMKHEWAGDEFTIIDDGTREAVTDATLALMIKNRDKAAEILRRFGAVSASQIKHADLGVALEALNVELVKVNVEPAKVVRREH